MSLSQKIEGAGVTGVNTVDAGAGAGAGAPDATPKAGKVGKQVTEDFKNQGQDILSKMSDDEKLALGSKRDTVAFKGVIVDPKSNQSIKKGNRVEKGKVVMGYVLKFLEDTDIPFAPYSKFAGKNDKLAVVYPEKSRHVTAGSTEYLNVYEAMRLVTRPEYSGMFTGEGSEVFIRPASSGSREVPLPTFSSPGAGSIKDNPVEAAEVINGEAVVKEEFKASFSGWFEKKRLVGGDGKTTKKNKAGDSAMILAAAFNAYFDKRNNEAAGQQ